MPVVIVYKNIPQQAEKCNEFYRICLFIFFFHAFVLLAGSKSAADMSLSLVYIEYLAHLAVKLGIKAAEPARDIHMYGRL